MRPRDQSPAGLKLARGFAQHDLEVERKHISGALLGGLYRNCTRAVLCSQLPCPAQAALTRDQTQSASLELGP